MPCSHFSTWFWSALAAQALPRLKELLLLTPLLYQSRSFRSARPALRAIRFSHAVFKSRVMLRTLHSQARPAVLPRDLSVLVVVAVGHCQEDLPSLTLPPMQRDLLRRAVLGHTVSCSPKNTFNLLPSLTSGRKASLVFLQHPPLRAVHRSLDHQQLLLVE